MNEPEIKTDIELYKEAVCDQYVRRKRYALQIERIDNSGLHAGEPMYFYCKECGVPTEVLPEDYLFPPHPMCSQCKGLLDEDLLESARKKAREEGL